MEPLGCRVRNPMRFFFRLSAAATLLSNKGREPISQARIRAADKSLVASLRVDSCCLAGTDGLPLGEDGI